MIYIENIFACMIAPLVVAYFCMPPKQRHTIVFVLCGFTACLFSAYINTFFAYWYGTDLVTATVEIAPVVEEIMKFLPVLFYLAVFEPEKDRVTLAMMAIALSFATFENICYLVENGTDYLQHLLIRGFGTGAMHLVCGWIVSSGLLLPWDNRWHRWVGVFGMLSIAIVFHGQYNLLMSGGSVAQYLACSLPIATVVCVHLIKRWIRTI